MLQPKPFRRERQPPPRLRRPPPPSFSRSVVAFLATHILSRRHHSKDMNDTVRIVNDEQRHVHHESSLPLLSRVHEFNATIANTRACTSKQQRTRRNVGPTSDGTSTSRQPRRRSPPPTFGQIRNNSFLSLKQTTRPPPLSPH